MRLASIFLKTLDNNFDPYSIKRAFRETNKLFLSQVSSSEEDIRDLLDVCKEFFPQTFLMKNIEYQRLWNLLETAYLQKR